jgi:pilus assembly protein Flp/PilA
MNAKDSWDFIRAHLSTRFGGEDGASLVEYAFLVGLIAIVCIAAVTFLGTTTSQKYSRFGSHLS